MNWKLSCALLGLVLALNVGAIAQCTWCQTVTDACCDGSGAGVNYQLPYATDKIYAQWDGPVQSKILFEIHDITGGGDILLASGELNCDCDKKLVYSGASIPSGNTLRLKASCDPCDGVNCGIGTPTIRFYTPSGNSCAPNCSGS